MHMLPIQKIQPLLPIHIQILELVSSLLFHILGTTTFASMPGSRTVATPMMSPSMLDLNNLLQLLVMLTPEIGDPQEPASFM